MSCITHIYKGKEIKFSPEADWCLCCFPQNYLDLDINEFDGFDLSQIKVFIYFSMAIRLIDENYFNDKNTIILPDDLPKNLVLAIDKTFETKIIL